MRERTHAEAAALILLERPFPELGPVLAARLDVANQRLEPLDLCALRRPKLLLAARGRRPCAAAEEVRGQPALLRVGLLDGRLARDGQRSRPATCRSAVCLARSAAGSAAPDEAVIVLVLLVDGAARLSRPVNDLARRYRFESRLDRLSLLLLRRRGRERWDRLWRKTRLRVDVRLDRKGGLGAAAEERLRRASEGMMVVSSLMT